MVCDGEAWALAGRPEAVQRLFHERMKLKGSGETKEKIGYADPGQCSEYLRKRIEGARSVNEALELIGDAVVASLLADPEELPLSKRTYSFLAAEEEVEKLLAADIKSVRPRRRSRRSGR